MSTEQIHLYGTMLPAGNAPRSASFAKISFEKNARSATILSAGSLPLYSGIPEMHEAPAKLFFRPFLRAMRDVGFLAFGIKKRFVGLLAGPPQPSQINSLSGIIFPKWPFINERPGWLAIEKREPCLANFSTGKIVAFISI